jgi:hypothetical protein
VQQTRAAVTSANDIVSLGIFGYSTGALPFDHTNSAHTANLFFNRLAEKISGNWVYTPLAYWPINPAINNTFFAYSPHSSEFPAEANIAFSNPTVSGYPTITYTVPEAVENQVDLLYSLPVSNINKTSNDGKVLYAMKHALSWIKFYVAPDEDSVGETYTVTSLEFTSPNLTTRATLNLGTGEWTAVAGPAAHYTFNVNGAIIEGGEVVEATANCLMLIPQQITDATVTISFIYTGDTDGDERSFSIPFPNVELSAGRISVYLLRINSEGAWIIFQTDNTIEAWIENHPDKDVYGPDVY